MKYSIMAPPAPRRGSARLYCPMVDVAAIEALGPAELRQLQAEGKLLWCSWRKRSKHRGAMRDYARHYRLAHLYPMAGVSARAFARHFAGGGH